MNARRCIRLYEKNYIRGAGRAPARPAATTAEPPA